MDYYRSYLGLCNIDIFFSELRKINAKMQLRQGLKII
jgi:hypothetical protein